MAIPPKRIRKSSPKDPEIKEPKSRGINDQFEVKPKHLWRQRILLIIVTAVITILITTLFTPLSKYYDQIWAKRPNTQIVQLPLPDDMSSSILIWNDGKAIDKVRIEIYLPYYQDTIKDIRVTGDKTITLLDGGIGNRYVIYEMDELWPQSFQIINIDSSSLLKEGAIIRAYSLFNDKIRVNLQVLTNPAPK